MSDDYVDFIPLRFRDPNTFTEAEKLQLYYQYHPEEFVRQTFNYEIWGKQKEIFEAVRDHKHISVASGHNIGKTFITSAICIWFVKCFPHAAVLTTASTFDQVKKILWKEIRRMVRRAEEYIPLNFDVMPKNPKLEYDTDRFIEGFGFAKPDSVQGCHNPNILIVFDEAQAIVDQEAWNAFSSMMTGTHCKHLAIGNPLYPYGPFPQTHEQKKWKKFNISCMDHPNVVNKRVIIPGAVTYEAIIEMQSQTQTGPGSMYWLTRVEGKFPQQGSEMLLPKHFVRKAAQLPDDHRMITGRWIGFDVASTGGDRCVVAVLIDGRIKYIEQWNQGALERNSDSAKRCLVIADKYNIPHGHINFDAVGPVGGQFKKCFQEMRVNCNAIYMGAEPLGDWDDLWPTHRAGNKKALGIKMFINRRAELHWCMRTLLEMEIFAIQSLLLEDFIYEACQLMYGYNDRGMLYIESKPKKYIPRVGISPDINDAVVLSLARDAVFKNFGAQAPSGADAPGGHSHRDMGKEKQFNGFNSDLID